MGDEAEMPDGEAPLEPPAPPPASEADPDYKVYLDTHDEEIAAEDLAEPAELERLRAYLDQQLEPLKGAVSRLATNCNAACKRSRTAAGNSTARKVFWTRADWHALWRTQPHR